MKNALVSAPSSQVQTPASFLAKPLLLPGEDENAYEQLLASVTSAVKPSDTIEEIWVNDVTHLTWEIFRWRKIKMNLIVNVMPIALSNRLPGLISKDALISSCAAQKPSAVKRVNKLLAKKGTSLDSVIASIVGVHIEKLERIDRLITIAETRRNNVFREIERYRSTFGQALHNKVNEVEEAEFATIEAKAITNEPTTKTAA